MVRKVFLLLVLQLVCVFHVYSSQCGQTLLPAGHSGASVFEPPVVTAKPIVCLNMIVKDESHIITRCLESVKPIIDYWVIVDTGSTDGTQDLIKEYMKDIPGELFERPWKDFGHNRSEAINLAREKGDYLLFMDADDWLEFDADFKLPQLAESAYQILFSSGNLSYYKSQLVSTKLPWRWVGVLHEYLTPDQPYGSCVLEGIRYVRSSDGARSKDPDKYLKCTRIFQNGLQKEPDNERYVFYLAESYRDAGFLDLAVKYYKKRVAMKRWSEEVYWSLLQIGKLQEALGEDAEVVIESYCRAHRYRPHRTEAIYYLAKFYNEQKRHDLAYEVLKGREFLPQPTNTDILFCESWINEWGLLFQLSICSYYLGHHQESLDICDQLSEMHLPKKYAELVKTNREFPLQILLNSQ